MDIEKFTRELCALPSVDGFEDMCGEKLKSLVLPYFDSVTCDSVGNFIFFLGSGKENAKRLLIDTHYDEVGLMVKGICDDGMLRICPIGGLDARLFPASEVTVYGLEALPGIVASKPQSLIPPAERGKLVPITDLLIDIGCSKEKAEKLVPIGSPVGYKPEYISLSGRLCGKGLDDKLCASAVIYAVSMLKEKPAMDLYFSMSAKEEVGQRASSSAAFRAEPDLAIALDVTFGLAPGGDPLSDRPLGKGPVVTRSLVTDKALSEHIIKTAEALQIPVQRDVCPTRTGTHADDIAFTRGGVPTALISIPIWFMHTAVETADMQDVANTAKLLCALLGDKKLKEACRYEN